MKDYYIIAQDYLNFLLEKLDFFLFPHLDFVVTAFLFLILFYFSVKNRPKAEYPSFAKELEREEVNIADLLATYLEAPAKVVEEVAEEVSVAEPETPAPVETPTEVAPEVTTQEAPKKKKRRKKRRQTTQRGAFIFKPKEAIIYNTILTKKY